MKGNSINNCDFFKAWNFCWGDGHCHYLPRPSKNLAMPLHSHLFLSFYILQYLFYMSVNMTYIFRIEKRKRVKERLQEIEDPPDLLAEKCQKLAEAVANSTNLVVYTGAGVSTAACIPDYRGTNGIWTLLQQGKDIG